MLFNSLHFLVFFIIVYALYLVLPHRWQNRMLLAASCVFYGAWDWRFLFLMFTSITVDYICALKIHRSDDERTRRIFLGISISINLAFLGFFKYFNFFAANAQVLLAHFGITASPMLLNIILPVGISFYTFEAITYVFDVYRRVMAPTTRYADYALFVTFFPHLVAGPIMKAKDLLPQIQNERNVNADKFFEGCHLFFWGLFQKVFIADNLAKLVDPFFSVGPPYAGAQVLLAVYAFAFQIYCDFAGYSNMARGLGKCMGFDIMINFNVPYFSAGPREFWQRWHISLSAFLRDYLYISMGGNRRGTCITYRNLAVTMVLGGLWHGASWTFVIWGAYQGLLLILYRLFQPSAQRSFFSSGPAARKIWSGINVIFFFHLICLGWLIFRASSVQQTLDMFHAMIFNFSTQPLIVKYYFLDM
ncbi:MAG: MBOAT family protein, partial [Candidatus Omnitrophica bacterium]|nr:MBOAT family protein [Candidatus Omnitrophota bacterium]